MRKLLGALIALLFIAGVGAAAGYGYYNNAVQTPSKPGDAATEKYEVKKGASLSQVAVELHQKGYIIDLNVFKIYLKLTPNYPKPKAGKHLISKGMNLPKLLAALAKNPLSEDVPLTMIEGWRLRDADAALTQKGLINPGEYLKAAKTPKRFKIPFKLESEDLAGYLLPETYMVPKGKLDVNILIQRQIDAFHKRFYQVHQGELKKSGRSLRTIVILASLLEREEPNEKTRPAVAGVMYNRLDKNTPLGIDATSRFTLDDWSNRRAFLKKLRDPEDPYNTRLRAGLPPGAIGAPSLPSLLAALRPKKGPYWYYLHDKNKQIHFSKTAAEHEAKRRKYNVW